MKKDDSDKKLDKALSVLDAVKTVFEVQNEAIKIKPFKYKEALSVLRILKDHQDAIPFELFNEGVDVDVQIKNIMTSACEAGAALDEIMKLHLKKDDQWIENLEIDEAIKIILAIIKVNSDFFTEKLLPMLPTNILENFKEERD